MIKVAKVEELREKFAKANGKVVRLEDEVEQLKNKVLNAKIDIGAEYKQSIEYQIFVGYSTEFLAKEKIKMRRLLQRAYNITNLSYLADINTELTFSEYRKEEKGKEVEGGTTRRTF